MRRSIIHASTAAGRPDAPTRPAERLAVERQPMQLGRLAEHDPALPADERKRARADRGQAGWGAMWRTAGS